MHLRLLMTAIISCFAMAFFAAAPAQGQTRTWVSGVGDDLNPCSRTAPCKTFAGAITKTANNGEINCLDPGGFGTVNITKSITIDCGWTHGSILAANTNGVLINGAGIQVTLRGLSINGAHTTTGNGVRILQADRVDIDDVVIENFSGTTLQGRGVTIETSTANVRVSIQNCRFNNINFVGIHSVPTGGSVILTVDNTRLSRTGSTHIDLRQLTTAALDGVIATNSPTGAGLTLELTTATASVSNSNFSNNSIGILNGVGAGAPITRIFNTTITNNTSSGLSITAGQVISAGNNTIRGNSGNETPSLDVGTD